MSFVKYDYLPLQPKQSIPQHYSLLTEIQDIEIPNVQGIQMFICEQVGCNTTSICMYLVIRWKSHEPRSGSRECTLIIVVTKGTDGI